MVPRVALSVWNLLSLDLGEVSITFSQMSQSHEPKKSRSWIGCLNNYTVLELDQLKAVPCVYCALGFHVGAKSELPHVHIDMEFKNQVHRPKFNPRIHWEPRRGNIEQALAYLNKEDKLEERGVRPRMPQRGGKDQVWASFIDSIHAGEVDKDSIMYARFSSYADRRVSELNASKTFDGELPSKNLWICGVTGCGKSRLAHEYSESKYLKNMNKWWDGYSRQKVVLIEDVDPDCFKIPQTVSNFKKWADRYPFEAEIKGGCVKVNAADYELVVTSQYKIRDCFSKTDADAVLRRFDVLKLY